MGWDNRRSLSMLVDGLANLTTADSSKPVHVTIIHGNKDQIVPVDMGRELHKFAQNLNPQILTSKFRLIRGADHNTIISYAKDSIFRAMRGSSRHKKKYMKNKK